MKALLRLCADLACSTVAKVRLDDKLRLLAQRHLYTSAYVSIRQHTSAYVSIRQHR